jgi:hypothetical protein
MTGRITHRQIVHGLIDERPDELRKYQLRAMCEFWHGTGDHDHEIGSQHMGAAEPQPAAVPAQAARCVGACNE